MLHLRRRLARALATPFGALRDWVAEDDPGRLRLQLSIRGTLSVFLASLAAFIAGRFGGFSPVECAGGVTLSMMGPFLMREPTRQQRQNTLLVLLLPAVAATVLTTLLHGQGPIGDSMFLVLVFFCFLLAPRSRYGIAVGLVAIVVTYIGLYLELPVSTLPIQIASEVLALPVIALACFVIVPMNPAATLRRAVAVVQARAARVIHWAGNADATAPQLRRSLLRLNEAALAADDQLALLPQDVSGPVRARLVDVELWTGRLIEAIRGEQPGSRQTMRLALHARRIGRGGRYAMQPNQFRPGSSTAALLALGHAVQSLGAEAHVVRPAGPAALPAAPPPPGPLAWRMAVRVTLASGLAMAGGMMLSPQRWFWAVITVYVVFLNARSRGDTIFKGVQRLCGTLLGIATGLILALTVAGDPAMEIGLLLGSIFAMYYFFLASYTAGIFCVTVMLGLLYGMLGSPLETVLTLRLEETAIGAVSAMTVAALVFPSRTRDQVRASGQSVLLRLAEVVEAARCALAGEPTVPPVEVMRAADRQVADLKLALAPLIARRAVFHRGALDRPVPALLDCVHWVRMLAGECQAAAGTATPAQNEALALLAQRLTTMAQGGQAQLSPTPAIPGENPFSLAIRSLSAATGLLAERLEIGAYEAFTLAG